MRKITTYITVLFSVLVIFGSCKKEYESVESLDARNLQSYKDSHKEISFEGTTDTYLYAITNPGTGSSIKNADSIYYSYSFQSLDGNTVFQETSEYMIPGTLLGYVDRFTINNSTYVLSPIREVMSKLKRGGAAILVLPSRLAFGKNGLSSENIGPNESLVIKLGVYEFEKKHQVDEYEINKFMTSNSLTGYTTDASKIRYKVGATGTGTDAITDFSTLSVNYTGRYLDGTVFDSGTGVSFRLDQLIKGWQLMLPGRLTAGGKMRIIVPSYLGYGTYPMDFDIEIVSVTNN